MNQKIGFILWVLFVLLAGHSTLFAQETIAVADEDMLAPFIDHSIVEGTQPEKTPIEFHATITDDNAVSEVSLFYRVGVASQKNEGYTEMTMTSNQTDGYAVSIPAEKMLGPKLEYYIQASDMAGNTASKGNLASPLVVVIGAIAVASPPDLASVQAATANEPDNKASVVEDVALFSTNNDAAAGESDAIYKPAKPWYKKWWVWTIAGVVLVGAAAGGGGGSGSSGGDSGSLSIAW
ncbi:MAG: hypothetical protein AAB035_03575 [Nitrospirota bacterium]